METDGQDHPAYEILLSCPNGLSPSQVTVDLNEAYDRIPHPDADLENSISEIWDARTQKNASLFNGLKFRYGGHTYYNGVGSNEELHVSLHLGLTDYRTFVGTNLSPLWERFLISSEDDCRRCQHTASPLGNGAVVETSDKKILVLQRSNNVGEFPGHYVFPGGHPEPGELGISSHLTSDHNNQEMIKEKLSQEMFSSIIREVVEEIGVPPDALGNPLFIGISRRVLNVRPAAFFFMTCSLESTEIQRLYCSAADAYESTQLYSVSMHDLEKMAMKMPGCHRGGYALFKLMKNAEKDMANGDT
ncbi:OLC1v1004172C1 [Oldenlandia corymbosa var. corymbosa]|uniref:OLC1v1004172C1 n=1 Tax=Oldenlandia corymbosa var. corymbosa TaxID=529605 RepID=A0AAV1DBL8_OLDCO|nr:OLC1v1004172C1 [Oldenlandia corymbosa var. corymbosa]